MATPAMVVRWIAGKISRMARKLSIEVYVLLKTCGAVFALFGGLWAGNLYVILCTISLVDLFSNILAIVLLRNFWHAPLSLNRTLISLGLNFIEFTAWFAGLYLHFDALRFGSASVTDSFSAYYFSVITSATIGYGDIVPTFDGRKLVVIEAFCSFIFLAVVVTYVIGSLGQPNDNASQEE
ncbi:ion channel [Rugamonas fusca]|nr:ion channel [Rugamonas fusca]